MSLITYVLVGFLAKEGVQWASERDERRLAFTQAREYSNYVSKPLLVVGAPKRVVGSHPCGDVTIDIDPNIDSVCPYEVADIRAIPYPSNYFGAAYCSHVLEHLNTIDDAVQALREMHRVADKVFVVGPHKTSMFAQLHPEHKLWILPTGDGYVIEQRGNADKVELVI